MRPGMLLVLQYPRRSQVTPGFLCVGQHQGSLIYSFLKRPTKLYFLFSNLLKDGACQFDMKNLLFC
jgi:hypothetical protein